MKSLSGTAPDMNTNVPASITCSRSGAASGAIVADPGSIACTRVRVYSS
jgi:hypothetical protein